MSTIDFIPFANDPTANVTTQAVWLGYASGGGRVQEGFPSGILASADLNKGLRQGTIGAAVLANFISQVLGVDVLDSGGSSNLTTLISQFKQAVQNASRITGEYAYLSTATVPSGWISAFGGTIGNASSSATARANADTFNLFSLYWNDTTGLYTVSSGKGASASNDFNANKTITTPDGRGRQLVGLDNMGGTAANRVTSGGSGINGSILGSSGGSETVSLTVTQMPSHSHVVNDPGHAHNGLMIPGGPNYNTSGTGQITSGTCNPSTTGITLQSTGGGGPHTNMGPALISNIIIKL